MSLTTFYWGSGVFYTYIVTHLIILYYYVNNLIVCHSCDQEVVSTRTYLI